MILDAQDDIFAKKRQNLFGLLNIEIIGMPDPRAETKTGHKELAGLLHRVCRDDKVGDVVQKIVHPPDVDIFGEKPHRHFDYVIRIRPVAE
jgi:hypothetical protein